MKLLLVLATIYLGSMAMLVRGDEEEVDDPAVYRVVGKPVIQKVYKTVKVYHSTKVVSSSSSSSSSAKTLCSSMSAKNPSYDCWRPCGSKGGKCSKCGAGGYCCRQGWKDCPAMLSRMGQKNHHACVQCLAPKPKPPALCSSMSAKNPSYDCWRPCGSKGGKCSKCGAGGYCCRQGWKDCPAMLSRMGQKNHHACVQCHAPKPKPLCSSMSAKNPSYDCWRPCGSKGGKCSKCGAGGYCCRQGWKDCPAMLSRMGQKNHHACVQCRSFISLRRGDEAEESQDIQEEEDIEEMKEDKDEDPEEDNE